MIDLRKFFTPDAIVQTVNSLADIRSQTLDTIYPESKRRSHPLPVVAVSDLQQAVTNIFLTKRGGEPEPIFTGSQSITHIEPQAFRPSERLSGVDVNNLRMLSTASIEQLIANKVDRLRRAVRLSTEVMAAQSLRGSIAYPMKVNGASGTYSVNFGSTLSYTPETAWDDSGITIAKVLEDIIAMEEVIRNGSSFGAEIKFQCGMGVFTALAKLVSSLGNDARITGTVANKSINIAGYVIELNNASYTDLANGNANTKVIGDKELMAVAVDAPFELLYVALDDLDANLAALPFFVKQVTNERNSTIELIAESKPLPVPYTKAVCWSEVLA
jgi:hypothetical protein